MLHVYDARPEGNDTTLTVLWHHGTPNTGEPPEPLLPAAARHGIGWVSYDRPGYGGSTPRPGRDIASAAADAAAVADALELRRFAVLGHSGGGPHALACAALLPDRVTGAVSVAGLAPFRADGIDWFAGMGPAGAAELRAAAEGRAALEKRLTTSEWDPDQFTPADHAALDQQWSWLGEIAAKASEDGLDGMIDDDLAYVAPWGFDPARISCPVLVLHGTRDRISPPAHAGWLAGRIPGAELRLAPDDGHISVLHSAPEALAWLAARG
ncbi:Pimeloyl-ACP methyl ester carboxylesterase [Streptomyces aidingensis]|uniref:Pimeloyl-ACP methyl ester carboxylesterase n=2 Tax=Streptomyces aidingensis TaxID=910347 RepID=A0A1I1JSA8_9ACTN|nr:Pimeloyl-ACP methyl ester carboxylesterase [Streptomyces aidingensis]